MYMLARSYFSVFWCLFCWRALAVLHPTSSEIDWGLHWAASTGSEGMLPFHRFGQTR